MPGCRSSRARAVAACSTYDVTNFWFTTQNNWLTNFLWTFSAEVAERITIFMKCQPHLQNVSEQISNIQRNSVIRGFLWNSAQNRGNDILKNFNKTSGKTSKSKILNWKHSVLPQRSENYWTLEIYVISMYLHCIDSCVDLANTERRDQILSCKLGWKTFPRYPFVPLRCFSTTNLFSC